METKEKFERAKRLYKTANADQKYVLESLFPELAESEGERIRNEIIAFVEQAIHRGGGTPIPQEQENKWIAWLKKQGKQIFANSAKTCKAEPKFKVGDWVIDKQDIVHQIANVIENVTYHTYGYDIVGGGYFNDNTEGVRLWTIQDAKAVDVLCCESGWTCIFKTLVNDETFSSYCFMDNTKWFCETGSECHTLKKEFVKTYNGKIYPATKEQRDTLFAKMKEAGYEWDADKKELKKIEQKSAWSEKYIADVFEKVGLAKIVREQSNDSLTNALQDAMIELSKFLPQPKQEWSEEDEKILNLIIARLHSHPNVEAEEYGKDYHWLKSLKQRYPWKPSDEQMKALKEAVDEHFDIDGGALWHLYEDLKKLRG